MNTTLALIVAIFLGLLLPALAAPSPGGGKHLRHVVSFKFKDGTSPAEVEKIVQAFRALKDRIPGIETLEWGTNNSGEGKNKGCTHAFILTFRSEKDRDAYLPHPAHQEFVRLVGPRVDDVFVFDFWAQE